MKTQEQLIHDLRVQKNKIQALLNVSTQSGLEKDIQIKALKNRRPTEVVTVDDNGSIDFDGIILTADQLNSLSVVPSDESNDVLFLSTLLLVLYTPDRLKVKSITGKSTNNKNYNQRKTEKLTPKKYNFILRKL